MLGGNVHLWLESAAVLWYHCSGGPIRPSRAAAGQQLVAAPGRNLRKAESAPVHQTAVRSPPAGPRSAARQCAGPVQITESLQGKL